MIVSCIGFGVQVITFYWVQNTFKVDPSWTERIEAKCGPMGDNIYKTYEYKSFVNAGVCFMPLFAFIGHAQSTPVSVDNFKDRLLLVLSSGILMAPGVVVHKWFTYNKLHFNGDMNAWVTLLGRTVVPSMLIGYLVFRYSNALFIFLRSSKPLKATHSEPLLPIIVAIN